MRFATLKTNDGLHAVVRDGQDYIDIAASNPHLPSTVRELFAGGPDVIKSVTALLHQTNKTRIPVDEARYAPVIPDPPKILGIGLNYRDHAIEGGKAIPTEPVLFAKFSNTLIGHQDEIRLPRVSEKVDYEAELVVVIGRKGRDISASSAMEYVAGYTCGHDVSARDWQYKGAERQWTIGKTFDTFAPIGPEIVTADEIADPHTLRVQMRLNGQTMQDSNTREFIFSIPQLIEYVSQVMTLEPGDLIFTGTPPGVGFARKPPVWLQPGDTTEIEIESVGLLRNRVAK